ncbi:unnamed protein product [Pseudo-nitzschia multistriata]|uniref:Fe2OG dioxygenase domain-containing protein n=1 Tax=Pseudo-nitzschia multistriata TaxID=183589 RepID=A0A448ZAR7_9STRA|nr:unnamed protein product [Pseudo-nitzschia multistriata]
MAFVHLECGRNQLQRQHHVMHSTAMPTNIVGPRVPINEGFPGLKKIYANPDIFVIENFLDDSYCQDLIDKASEKKLVRSPVAYAGWTEDFKDLVELSSKGPIAWIALLSSWFQVKNSGGGQVDLVVHALQNYAVVFVVTTILIGGFTYSRAEGLKALRTSTSTTLDDMTNPSSGAREFVRQASKLFHSNEDFDTSIVSEAALFEAPTVIRYEPDQILAPHYDANRSAETEDANRGGQTLATLLVYLNDVERGGLTRFGKLSSSAAIGDVDRDRITSADEDKLIIQPKRGDALLFFPADRNGQFDPRTEHEGMPAIDEKWIARIWKHQRRVPAPFGLSEASLSDLG